MESFLEKLRTASLMTLLERAVDSVEGYLTNLEGFALYALAWEGEGAGAIVEIGSYAGRSTCYLALGTRQAKREKVYAVDTFRGSAEHQRGGDAESAVIAEHGSTLPLFRENVAKLGLTEWVEPIERPSIDAAKDWSGGIRLLFIDGDHTYEACRADFEAWAPFVVARGCVAFHDYGHAEGVTRVCDELPQRHPEFRQLAEAGSMVVFQKRL